MGVCKQAFIIKPQLFQPKRGVFLNLFSESVRMANNTSEQLISSQTQHYLSWHLSEVIRMEWSSFLSEQHKEPQLRAKSYLRCNQIHRVVIVSTI